MFELYSTRVCRNPEVYSPNASCRMGAPLAPRGEVNIFREPGGNTFSWGRPEPGEPNPGSYSITVTSQIQILLAFLSLAQICNFF